MEQTRTKLASISAEDEDQVELKGYEQAKKAAAMKVHKWIMEDPAFWQAKADELVRWCERTHVPNPLDDIRGTVDHKDNKVKPRCPTTFGERSLRASYLACLLLHDSCGDFEPICKWPTQPLPGKYGIPLSLEAAGLSAFDAIYGEKTAFIELVLHVVKKDQGRGAEVEDLIAAHLSGVLNAAIREGMTAAELDDMWAQVRENLKPQTPAD